MIAFQKAKVIAVAAILMSSSIALVQPTFAKSKEGRPSSKSSASKDDPGCRECVAKAASLFAQGKLADTAGLLRSWKDRCPNNSQLFLMLSSVLVRVPGQQQEAMEAARTASSIAPESVAANTQYALTLMALEDSAEAARVFEKVVKLDPSSYEAWSSLSNLYAKLHDEEKSKSAASKAACLEPQTKMSRLRQLRSLEKAGRISELKGEFRKMFSDPDLEPEFFIELGKESMSMGLYDEASQALTKATTTYPDAPALLESLAQSQLWARKYAASIQTADKILAAHPKHANALAIKAIASIHAGDLPEARRCSEAASQRQSEAPLVLLAVAWTKSRDGDYAEALKNVQLAISKDSTMKPARVLLAQIYFKLGQTDEALGEARELGRCKALAAKALGLESRIRAGSSNAEDKAESSKLAVKASGLDKADPEALLAMAALDNAEQKFDAARASANDLISAEPGNGEAYLALARAARGANNLDEERKMLQKCLTVAKDDADASYLLGKAMLDVGQAKEAVAPLRAALRAKPESPVVAFALASALDKSGDSTAAVEYFKLSLSSGLKGPDQTVAQDSLKRLEGKNN